jgi:hypothetical protein
LLVVEDLTQAKIDAARERLSCAYERVEKIDNVMLRV